MIQMAFLFRKIVFYKLNKKHVFVVNINKM